MNQNPKYTPLHKSLKWTVYITKPSDKSYLNSRAMKTWFLERGSWRGTMQWYYGLVQGTVQGYDGQGTGVQWVLYRGRSRTVQGYGWYGTRVRVVRYKSTGGTICVPLVPTNPYPKKSQPISRKTQPILDHPYPCTVPPVPLYRTTRTITLYHPYPCTLLTYPCTVPPVPPCRTPF